MQRPPFVENRRQPTHPLGSISLRAAALVIFTAWSAIAASPAVAELKARQPLVLPTRSSFQPIPINAEHLRLLRQGGLVIYMRHGPSDANQPDQLPIQLNDCSTQRPLTDAGRQQLRQTARYIARLQLPYQGVISSPFCRVEESARIVFGDPVLVDVALRYTAAMPEAEKRPAVERTRYWLSLPVQELGLNRVVVAHGPNLAELINYLPSEGTMTLFRPLGLTANPSFEYLASVAPAEWEAALKALRLR